MRKVMLLVAAIWTLVLTLLAEMRHEKVVKESRGEDGSPKDHPYAKGQSVLLSEEEAKELEAKGYVVPLGGWVGEKDMGEVKTDNEVGLGYGPDAIASRNSNVVRSFAADELEADKQQGDPAFQPNTADANLSTEATANQAEGSNSGSGAGGKKGGGSGS